MEKIFGLYIGVSQIIAKIYKYGQYSTEWIREIIAGQKRRQFCWKSTQQTVQNKLTTVYESCKKSELMLMRRATASA